MFQTTRLTTSCALLFLDESTPFHSQALTSDKKGGTVYINFFHVMSCSDVYIIHPLTPLKMGRTSA